jgi:hypothetical protein
MMTRETHAIALRCKSDCEMKSTVSERLSEARLITACRRGSATDDDAPELGKECREFACETKSAVDSRSLAE